MGDAKCFMETNVKENEILNANSPSRSDNEHFPIPRQEQTEAVMWSPENGRLHDGLDNSDTEELFKHIPELKDIFHIKSKIGEGTFSNVYLAHYVEDPNELYALKHIIPTSAPNRVEREVRCLQQMGGKNNVIGYKGTLRNRDHSAIILPYCPHDKFQDYLQDMTVTDIRDYMKNLLLALQHIHCFSIIHRDIKPGNFLHSRNLKRYNLVDFGLAMHEPGSAKAWEIEKKKGNNDKKITTKNVQLLSPGNQNSKKSRTSPRVSVPSHKFARQTCAVMKCSLRSSLKPGYGTNTSVKVDTKKNKEETKLGAKNGHQNTQSGKALSLGSSKSGLCETSHKKIDVCSLCMKRLNIKKIDVCSLCMKRNSQNAPRAGTSGFRAPEVLMKQPNQTTAVDVWSAGVIMLCLLSGRYPFFRCYDDMTALAQLISLFGKQRIMACSKHLGKYMVCKSNSAGFDLKKVCQKLRLCSGEKSRRRSNKCCMKCSKDRITKAEGNIEENSPGRNLRNTHSRTTSVSTHVSSNSTLNGKTKVRFLSTGHSAKTEEVGSGCLAKGSDLEHLDGSQCDCHCGSCSQYVPNSAYDFLEKCLDVNPTTRITASEALNHPFLANNNDTDIPSQPER